MDFELLLQDRLGVIRDTINKYGEDNFYLSFSGGKDSTILHYLLDIALPNNKIPRVFIDTGIEYFDIRDFVYFMKSNDSRFVIIRPSLPVKDTLEKYGYPFKSKEHSLRVYWFNKGSNAKFISKYINGSGTRFGCPKMLLYQFLDIGKYNYSNLCCYKLKKEPVKLWEKENNRFIVMTGIRNSEGGNRSNIGCITGSGRHIKFHPLVKVDDEFEDIFIKKFNILLCKLYYPPYNFKRTGCKGCPFNKDLKQQLDTMKMYLPNEYRQCNFIWSYVYNEYRRLNYRINTSISIFD